MQVSVIIPTYRRFDVFLDTLDEVLRQDYDAFEVIVVDQNAAWPDDMAPRRDALRKDPRVKWHTIEPIGVVRARNFAVSETEADLLLFIDDDVVLPDPLFIQRHVDEYVSGVVDAVLGREITVGDRDMQALRHRLEQEYADGTSGFTLPTDDEITWTFADPLLDCMWFNRENTRRRPTTCICTCNASVRRSVFLEVGGFDEHFRGNSYGDDYDLGMRLHEAGKKIIYSPLPWLIHLQHKIGGLRMSDPANTSTHYDRAVSRCLFAVRYARPGWRIRLLRDSIRKTILTRPNLKNPLYLVQAMRGYAQAMAEAARIKDHVAVSPLLAPAREREGA